MSAINNFVENVASSENNNDATAVSEKQETTEMTPIESLREELNDEQVELYRGYEVTVDTGRFVSKLAEATGNEAYDDLLTKVLAEKDSLRKKCADLPGNLPMFRHAFPAADADDVWILPKGEAADVGIDYDDEDHIVLPFTGDSPWHPTESLGLDHTEGAGTFMEESEPVVEDDENAAADDDEVSDFVVACENADLDPVVVDADLEGYPVPSSGTVADLKETLRVFEKFGDVRAIETLRVLEEANKNRTTALAAIHSSLKAVEKAEAEEAEDDADDFEFDNVEDVEDDDDDEASDVSNDEPEPVDEVEAAKIEALTALTETMNKTVEVLESL